jgi:hypothetical protein
MAFVVNDRVQEFTSTTGTGTLTLTGSPDGFETFSSAVGNGNTTYYTISSNTTEFEVGIGTVGAGTLSRDTVISSSNSDALVNFSAGTKNVFVTLPASKTILSNDSNIVNVPGAATFAAGTVSLPSITTTGDTNTGIFFPAADTIAFTEGGAEAMRILNNGDVAIGRTTANFSGLGIDHTVLTLGTTTGMGMLELAGFRSVDGDLGRLIFGNKNVRLSEIVAKRTGADNASALSFSTSSSGSNTERMRIDSSGNVGIGTSSPAEKLEVVGTIVNSSSFLHNVNNSLKIISGGNATNAGANLTLYGGTEASIPGVFRFRNGASESMRITSSGNLGIGTDSPDAKLSVNGVASFGDGTALLPSIANFGDLNTGMWFPAADTIAFSEGGTEAMRIDSNGAVSIATTSAINGEKLKVQGKVYINAPESDSIFTTGACLIFPQTYNNIRQSTDHSLVFDAWNNGNVNSPLTIKQDGKIGIGTDSPDAKLHVNGLIEANGSLYRGIFGGAVQDGDMTGATGGNGSEVQIQSPSSIRPASLTLGGSLGNNELLGVIGFYNSGNTDGKRLRAYIRSGQEGATANEQGALMVFSTASDAASTPTERMRIDSSGNVGIGTSNAQEKLNVIGSIRGDGLAGDPNYGFVFKARYDGATPLELQGNLSGQGWGIQNFLDWGENGLRLFAPFKAGTNTPMIFSTSGSERMRIDSSGNVGIGTSSPDYTLSIEKNNGPQLSFRDTSGGTDSKVWLMSGLDSDFRLQALSDNLATGEIAYAIGRSGATVQTHQFYTTDNERMRINSSGNVGIGTTAPDALLSVNGVASFGDGYSCCYLLLQTLVI